MGNKKGEELKQRSKLFALNVIAFVNALPPNKALDVFGRQLLRAATSVGANYRAVCRAKSQADFLSKLATVEEEADECCYWLELMRESGLVEVTQLSGLLNEANELTSIFVASIRSAKRTSRPSDHVFSRTPGPSPLKL